MRAWRIALASALALALAACGEGDGSAPVADAFVPAHGYVVGWVPDAFGEPRRYEPHTRPFLSPDGQADVEPFLVVVPDGWDRSPDEAVFATRVDGSGAEGGLEQILPGVPYVEDAIVSGRQTWRVTDPYTDGYTRAPRQVSARVSDELGVRVHSVAAPMRVLDAIATAATIDGDRPALRAPPAGWSVVSQLDGAQAANLEVEWMGPGSDAPGVGGALVTSWAAPSSRLEVAVIGAEPNDVLAAGLSRSAIGYDTHVVSTTRRVGAGWAVETVYDDPGTTEGTIRTRQFVTLTSEGSILAVGARTTQGTDPPSLDDLQRIARSVRIDPGAWDAARRADRHRRPQPDPGHEVVLRGETAGVAWLVQDLGPYDVSAAAAPTGVARVNPELILAGGERIQPNTDDMLGPVAVLPMVYRSGGGHPPFDASLVLVAPEAASISFGLGGERIATSPAPGGRIAVVESPPDMSHDVIVRYDAAGNVMP